MTSLPTLPHIGKPMTREEAMDGLWTCYRDSVDLAKQDDPTTVGFPDLEALLSHIEEHGFPAPEGGEQ